VILIATAMLSSADQVQSRAKHLSADRGIPREPANLAGRVIRFRCFLALVYILL